MYNLSDRRGVGNELGNINEETYAEMVEELVKIVQKELDKDL